MSKKEVQEKIDDFFSGRDFSSDDARKIKRLAMKFKIRLGNYRRKFCKKCFSPLKGKTRVTKTHKTVVCSRCGTKNKFHII